MDFLEKYGRAIQAALLAAIPLFLFFPVLEYEFTWDDEPLYLNERNFPEEGPFNNFAEFWEPSGQEMYIPVTKTVWAGLLAAGSYKYENGRIQTSATKFHAANLLAHVLNILLVYLILFKLIKNGWAAFAGALLFGLHPLQVESVAWVSELRGLLSAFFGFMALYLYISGREDEGGSPFYKWGALGAFALSALSKPGGIVFILIAIIIDLIFYKPGWKGALKWLGPWLAVAVPVAALSVLAESRPYIDSSAPLWARPLIYFDSLAFYLQKLVYPVDMAASYGHTVEKAMNSALFYYWGAIPLVLLGIIIWKWNSAKGFAAALLIFMAGFLAVSGIIPYYYQFWSNTANRYVYVSMLGAGLALTFAYDKIKNNLIRIPAIAAIIIAAGYFSYIQLPYWENGVKLWSRAIELYPGSSPNIYHARADEYHKQGQPQKAMRDYNTLIKMDSSYPGAYLNRGNLYYDLGRPEQAIKDFTEAINKKTSQNPADVYYNRGKSYLALGDFRSAASDYTSALKYPGPGKYQIYSERGIAFAEMGLIDSAIKDFSRALAEKPSDEAAYRNLQRAIKLKELRQLNDTANKN